MTGKRPKREFYDVLIIGCGITGAMAAEALSGLGLKVLVVDRRAPAAGSTSASTALIQWEIDEPLRGLAKKVGQARAAACYKASFGAVRRMKRQIPRLKIDCDMIPRKTLLIAGNEMGAIALKREAAARGRLGLPSRFLSGDELRSSYGFKRAGAILSEGSIEIDPRKLALGLARIAARRGVEIVAPTSAANIYASDAGVLVRLSDGSVIAARKVIAATGYETLPEISKSKYDLISTWALATVKQPDAAFWGDKELVWEASDPYLYFRATADGRIIVGGEDAAYVDAKRRDRQIRKKAKRILEKLGRLAPHAKLQADYMWAGTFAESPTGLPAIGSVEELPNVFAILGAGGNGITFSAIASELAKAWVMGKDHPLARLFSPHRSRKRG